jgi:hypothetical protein
MPNFSDYTTAISLLEDAQEADQDNREAAREAHDFVDKRDGQWEQHVSSALKDQPQYTYDKANPIVDQIAGRVKQKDFGIKIKPAGGEATEDDAKLRNGMIRNIHNISNADDVYDDAITSVVTGGYDGWEIVQAFVDDSSFDQDLLIQDVPNFIDSVWFDTNSLKRDRSDSDWGFKLVSFSKIAYDEKWPKGSGQSVSEDRTTETYVNKVENVIVGSFYYVRKVTRDILRMSDGRVFDEEDESYIKVKDELAATGITVKDRRSREKRTFFIRQFDGGGWLNEEEKTVFSLIPLIPEYGKFKVTDSKIIWRGAVEKIMDPCRVINYAESRKVGEGALTPKDKMLMTREQAEGNQKSLSTMNTNNDPVLFYNHVEGQPIPFKIGSSQINPGLSEISQSANQAIKESVGLFDANMGSNPGLQSGVAIDSLKESGDTGNIDWNNGHKIAICAGARVILDALPRVYDAKRIVRILGEDGASEMKTINDQSLVADNNTGEMVKLNDLSKGRYDVTCDVGKSFASRQEESVAAIVEMAQLDPSIVQLGSDILLNNSNAPGLDEIGVRRRRELFEANKIPESQWTDEERQEMQQAQQQAQDQPQQPDPLMVAAQAEMQKAQAETLNAQNKQNEIQGNQQISMADIQLRNKQIDLDTQKFLATKDDKFDLDAAKINQNQQALDLKADQQQFNAILQTQQLQSQQFNDMFANLKTLTDAMQTFVGPHLVEAGINQAVGITEAQEEQGLDTSIGEDVTQT